MKNTFKLLGFIALIAIIGLLAACDNGTIPKDNPPEFNRYITVPYGSAAFNTSFSGARNVRSAANTEPYRLVFSTRDVNTHTDYYIYYLGFIGSVPIHWSPTVSFNGTTPITNNFTLTRATEQTVTQSMTTAREHSVNAGLSTTVGASVTGEVAVPLVA